MVPRNGGLSHGDFPKGNSEGALITGFDGSPGIADSSTIIIPLWRGCWDDLRLVCA